MSVPAGFVRVGTLVGEVYGGINVDVRGLKSCKIPKRFDRSYQMKGGFPNSGGGAQSSLTGADIPPGFYIECSGTDTIGMRWSVSKPAIPIYQEIDWDGPEGEKLFVGGTFTLSLYADCGRNNAELLAKVKVDVYYKPLD